jgi:insulysin
MPKVNVMALIQSSVISESPETSVLSMLWVEVIQEQLNEFSYLASMAGLHCSVSESRTGIQLSLSGYNEKAHILYQRVIDTMRESPNRLDEDLYLRVKDMTDKKLKNFLFSQPYQHAIYAADLVLEYGKWTIEECLDALDQVTLKSVVAFAHRIMSRFHLEILVHGNVSAQDARDKFAMVTLSGLDPFRPWRCTIPELRVVELMRAKEYHLRFKEPNANNTNSSIEVIYQIGAMELYDNAILALLNHLMKEPSFDELRTKEQVSDDFTGMFDPCFESFLILHISCYNSAWLHCSYEH